MVWDWERPLTFGARGMGNCVTNHMLWAPARNLDTHQESASGGMCSGEQLRLGVLEEETKTRPHRSEEHLFHIWQVDAPVYVAGVPLDLDRRASFLYMERAHFHHPRRGLGAELELEGSSKLRSLTGIRVLPANDHVKTETVGSDSREAIGGSFGPTVGRTGIVWERKIARLTSR